jgi:hypothetical protein
MLKKTGIRFCYRKVIDATTTGLWESHVFNDSYQEFLMQAQLYNQEKKYTSFAQLIQHVKGAEQLHFLVSSAVVGYVRQLNNIIPDIVNALGKTFLAFSNFRFEIINSDVKDKGRHQVAVNFYSDELVWLETIGTQLLVSFPGKEEDGTVLTELVTMQPFLSIYSIKAA